MSAVTRGRTRRVAAIVLRHFFLLRGSLARVVPLFAWVAVDIVLWGFITRYLNRVAAPGYDFVPALLGAVLLWDFFTRVMQGVTMAFFARPVPARAVPFRDRARHRRVRAGAPPGPGR